MVFWKTALWLSLIRLMVQIPLEETNIGEGYWRLCHLMGWILQRRGPIFLPGFYTFFGGKGVIIVKCFNLVNTIISTEEPSSEGLYRNQDQPIDLLCKTFGWFLYGVGFYWKVLSCRVCSHCLSVKLLSAMVIVVLSKSLVHCYYVVCN